MQKSSLLKRLIAICLIIAMIVPAGVNLRVSAEEAQTGIIVASELYMRTAPSKDADKVMVNDSPVILVRDQEVAVIETVGDWYHVRAVFNGQIVEGYSLSGQNGSTYIKLGRTSGTQIPVPTAEPTPEPTAAPTPKPTKAPDPTPTEIPESAYAYGAITASVLNMRTGPSTDYAIRTVKGENVVFSNGQEVTVMWEENGWYKVSAVYKGTLIEGYCKADYVDVTDGKPISKNGTSDAGDKTAEPTKELATATPTPTPVPVSTDTKIKVASKTYYKAYDEIPDGVKVKKLGFTAKYDVIGTTNASDGLNLRDDAGLDANIITSLPKGTEIVIINAKNVTTTNSKGVSEKVRWYKVVAPVGNSYVAGFVNSAYVNVSSSKTFPVKVNKSKLYLYTDADCSAKVRNSAGKKVSLAKKTVLTVTGETESDDGAKYFAVTLNYKGETVSGYVPASKVVFATTTKKLYVKYLKVTEAKTPEATPTPIPDDSDGNKSNLGSANAVIKDAPGLTVHLAASNSSDMLYTESGRAVMLYTGDQVEIVDVSADGESIWCYIKFMFNGKEYYGYIRSTHLETSSSFSLMSMESQASAAKYDFETKLTLEGFPESYKEKLRLLHEQYPLWEFKAFHTGLDWNEVVANETEVGRNVLPNDYSIEWKSLEPGAYSWKNDTFVVFDYPSWVTASKEATSYYLDPRNFLTENEIFQFEILTYSPSYQNIEGVRTILGNTALSGTTYTFTDVLGQKRTISYEETFIMAAEYSGVSPYHLASRVKQEVTVWPMKLSQSVSGTVEGCEGYYNFYNIAASDSTVAGGAIKKGLTFAKNGTSNSKLNVKYQIPWNNRFSAILGGAAYIGNNYVHVGQNTLYLQKFNMTSVNTYGHQYMTNVEAPYSEGVRLFRGYEDLINTPVIFTIPVFLNMPETVCGKPEKAYNPNNWLKSLKVYNEDGDKLALTPTFDYTEDQEYSLIVDSDTSYLKFKGTTVSELAKVVSAKEVYPVEGYNVFNVSVQAENGNIRNYVINVYRESAPSPTPVAEPTAEPTPEVTPEPTPEVTPEITPEASPEVTPEITAEAAEEGSSEVTPELTPEVTP